MKSTVRLDEGYTPTGKNAPVQLRSGKLRRLIHPDTVKSQNIGVAVLTMNPGDEVAPHYHKTREEVYFILSGEGISTHRYKNGEEETVRYVKGLSIYLPMGTVHDIKVAGNEPLEILVIASPALPMDDSYLA